MLFKPRGVLSQKEEKPKNQMTLGEMLAFRDTWVEIPREGFSVERILLEARIEKQLRSEVPKLVMSENGFRVRDKMDMDASEIELRRVQGALNKLTDQNFDSVVGEMLSEDLICNTFVLKGAVNIIFSKAVAEPVFSSLYARLCARIANYERELVSESEKKPELNARLAAAQPALMTKNMDEAPRFGAFVRTVLITRCQAFYQQFVGQAIPESAEAEEHLRKQNMANIKFLGELYVKSMVKSLVIAFVASYSLALCWEPAVTKTTVSDVDLELAYNLFMVVGKKFDETAPENMVKGVWDQISKFADDMAFSMRIRCLLQNLIDLRKNNWKPKETPHLTSSSGNNDENTESSNQTQEGGAQHRGMPRPASVQYQDSYSNRRSNGMNTNPMAGARRGDRVTSYSDLGQFGGASGASGEAGAGGASSHVMPPLPPSPPPPFSDAVTDANDEDKKLVALALPPPSLTSAAEMKLVSVLRDAITDGDWEAASASIAEAVPGEPMQTCIACTVYAAVKKMCLSSHDSDRKTFSTALENKDVFDVPSLSRGYSWFLTSAIVNNYKEDAPRVISHFVNSLVSTKSMEFTVILRDVMACTANYLDVLYVPFEGNPIVWEEDIIEVWSSLLGLWSKNRSEDPDLNDALKIVECLANIQQRPFMRDIAPDFLMELSQNGLLPDDAIRKWVGNNGKEKKYETFVEQLEHLLV